MIRSLLWKEFREHIFKMLTLLAILLALVIWTESSIVPRTLRGSWEPLWIGAAYLAPVWLGAMTITNEKSWRTEIILASLPISRTVVFVIKTISGVLTFVLPLTLSLFVGEFSMAPWERPTCFAMIVASVTLYMIILCIGMGIRREGVAAIAGVLILLISGIWYVVVGSLLSHSGMVGVCWWLLAANPFGVVWAVSDSHASVGYVLFGQIWATGAYWVVSAKRYARDPLLSGGASVVPASVVVIPMLPKAVLRHPLIWKERREQLSILILTAIVGFVLAILFGVLAGRGSGWRPNPGLMAFNDTLAMFFMMGTTIPTIVAAILGISAISADMDDATAAFWQSRPIRAAHLFWSKYFFALLGLMGLGLFFEIPYVVSTHPAHSDVG